MSRDISLLHPKLRALIPVLMEKWKAAGLDVLITDGFRSKAEQDALYAQGRTKSGQIVTNTPYPYSTHNWGVAFDFCRNKKGAEYYYGDGFFNKAAAIAKPYGLSWGGDWKNFVDRPHLELTEFSSVATLIKLFREPKEFMLTWGRKEEDEVHYRTLGDLPPELEYAKRDLLELMRDGILLGDGNKNLEKRVINLSEDMIRTIILCKRMTAR